MKFSDTIEGLHSGKNYAREGWEDKSIYLGTMPNPAAPTRPVLIIMQNASWGGVITKHWLTADEDREREDWYEVDHHGATPEEEADQVQGEIPPS